MNRRGFTLVEMMVAVLISAGTVVVAAKVAQIVTSQSIKGAAATEEHDRSGLIGQQLRAEIQVAGYGSTGLVSFDPAAITLPGAVISVGGQAGIPAVSGANGLGPLGLGGQTVQTGSDMIQLIVPSTAQPSRTIEVAVEGGNLIRLDPATPLTCPQHPFVLIVDHSKFNGTGRTQLAPLAAGGGTVTINGGMMFSAAAGSEVMCARVSTYWVDQAGWLHRSDLAANGNAAIAGGPVHVGPAVGSILEHVAPGVVDLQVAFRVSAAAYDLVAYPGGPGVPLGAATAARWAFEDPAVGPIEGLMAGTTPRWAEVRQVRMDFLMRTLRRGTLMASPRDLVTTRRMDAAGAAYGTAPLARGLAYDWESLSETIMTLRMFDKVAAAGHPAEPI